MSLLLPMRHQRGVAASRLCSERKLKLANSFFRMVERTSEFFSKVVSTLFGMNTNGYTTQLGNHGLVDGENHRLKTRLFDLYTTET